MQIQFIELSIIKPWIILDNQDDDEDATDECHMCGGSGYLNLTCDDASLCPDCDGVGQV